MGSLMTFLRNAAVTAITDLTRIPRVRVVIGDRDTRPLEQHRVALVGQKP